MKKTISILALVAAVVLAFVSCEKVGDDIYFPKMKLASVLDENGDGFTLIYNGKYISTIDVDGQKVSVKYNTDDQISELIPADPADGKIVMSYVNKKISRIEYFNEVGVLEYYLEFTHDVNGKIAKVKTNSKDLLESQWKALCENKMFAAVFDTTPIEMMLKKSSKGQFDLELEEYWSYNGDNLETVSSAMEIEGYLVNRLKTYTYDEHPNPYFGLPYVLGIVSSYSRNNFVACVETTSMEYAGQTIHSDTQSSSCSYVYGANKYPITANQINNGRPAGTVYFTYIK